MQMYRYCIHAVCVHVCVYAYVKKNAPRASLCCVPAIYNMRAQDKIRTHAYIHAYIHETYMRFIHVWVYAYACMRVPTNIPGASTYACKLHTTTFHVITQTGMSYHVFYTTHALKLAKQRGQRKKQAPCTLNCAWSQKQYSTSTGRIYTCNMEINHWLGMFSRQALSGFPLGCQEQARTRALRASFTWQRRLLPWKLEWNENRKNIWINFLLLATISSSPGSANPCIAARPRPCRASMELSSAAKVW